MTQNQETIKIAVDGLSLGTLIGTFLGWLPHVAAILSIVWVSLRIYESVLTIKKLKKD